MPASATRFRIKLYRKITLISSANVLNLERRGEKPIIIGQKKKFRGKPERIARRSPKAMKMQINSICCVMGLCL